MTDPAGNVCDEPIPMLTEFRMADRFGWQALEGWARLPIIAQELLVMILNAESEGREWMAANRG
jgi:hypothetical protein